MTEYTPTTEELRQQYKALAQSRLLGVTYTSALRARGAEFDRWLAAHDAEVRAGVVAEEPEWEYGSAIREVDGDTWDHEFFTRTPITADQLREWNEEHAIGNDSGSIVIAVRQSIPRVEEWVPVKQGDGDA